LRPALLPWSSGARPRFIVRVLKPVPGGFLRTVWYFGRLASSTFLPWMGRARVRGCLRGTRKFARAFDGGRFLWKCSGRLHDFLFCFSDRGTQAQAKWCADGKFPWSRLRCSGRSVSLFFQRGAPGGEVEEGRRASGGRAVGGEGLRTNLAHGSFEIRSSRDCPGNSGGNKGRSRECLGITIRPWIGCQPGQLPMNGHQRCPSYQKTKPNGGETALVFLAMTTRGFDQEAKKRTTAKQEEEGRIIGAKRN